MPSRDHVTPVLEETPGTAASPGHSRPHPPWAVLIALAIALIAIALAAWSLLRPLNPSTEVPSVTAQQATDAKARACTASNTVSSAVSLQTHTDPGIDFAATQAVAANARLSMITGSTYLLARLDPATPPPLAAQIRSLADELQAVTIHTMAGVNNDEPAQAARLHDVQAISDQIANLCK